MAFEKLKEYSLYIVIWLLWLWILIGIYFWVNNTEKGVNVVDGAYNSIIDWINTYDVWKQKNTIITKFWWLYKDIQKLETNIDTWYVTYANWESINDILINDLITNDDLLVTLETDLQSEYLRLLLFPIASFNVNNKNAFNLTDTSIVVDALTLSWNDLTNISNTVKWYDWIWWF